MIVNSKKHKASAAWQTVIRPGALKHRGTASCRHALLSGLSRRNITHHSVLSLYDIAVD